MDNTTEASEFNLTYELPPPSSFQRRTAFAVDSTSFSVARVLVLLVILGALGAIALWLLNNSSATGPVARVELVEVSTPRPVQLDNPAVFMVPVERVESTRPSVSLR